MQYFLLSFSTPQLRECILKAWEAQASFAAADTESLLACTKMILNILFPKSSFPVYTWKAGTGVGPWLSLYDITVTMRKASIRSARKGRHH